MYSTLSLDHIAIAAIAGILPLLFMSALPPMFIWWLLAVFALLAAVFNQALIRLVAVFLLSFLWAVLCADQMVQQVERYADQSAHIQGKVISANINAEGQRSVLFQIRQINGRELSMLEKFQLPLYFSINKQDIAQQMFAGQLWQGNILFRAVHSRLNQGGYDQQRWAMANHQPLTGLVKSAEILDSSLSLRQSLINRIYQLTEALESQDILLALAFGERGMIQPDRRQVFLKTGTAHLMAISGLHISLAALFGWGIARGIQFLFSVRYLGPRFPLLVGWGVATLYVWLSGANPPALRAFFALSIWMVLRWHGMNWTPWQVWLRIVALLLISDPLMVLSDSLWLSCLAVAGIIFWFQWVPLPAQIGYRYRSIVLWVYLQIAMMILLIPMQIIIFHGISWTALLGNLVAVPVVSFISVPAILSGLLLCWSQPLAVFFWWIADRSIIITLFLLEKLQHGWETVTEQMILISFSGWLLIICWRLSLWRCGLFTPWIILLLTLLPLWQRDDENWRIDMLDVGHGLAMVIRQGNRAIIYDTGNRWRNGSMAEREILPFLRWHGLTVEGIILSHQDSDHAGGLSDLQQAYPDAWLRTSTLSLGESCQQGDSWRWRGLTFYVLWPQSRVERAYNAHSCVIRVSDGRYSILLTGDLEKAQELSLIRLYGDKLKSDVMQTPHHGSKTSSTASFIQEVNPKMTLTSVSRYNPWRLPAENVVKRYKKAQVEWISTAKFGQVSVLFYKDYYKFLTLRVHFMPRWYHQWFGSSPYNE
ncbi:ComEC family competence protein [Pragia fontium]|uniref:DNA internalization-related competence protein ComEC/Rec2 n=1 Tax=Pragia fontium TaxID=82985 RepID=UPI000E012673|nr:DNA internalization-related competence protein ComEC/Rec2 [Pragia fontium]SUB82951.1 ComEC family competence protein [Pragia fontium]